MVTLGEKIAKGNKKIRIRRRILIFIFFIGFNIFAVAATIGFFSADIGLQTKSGRIGAIGATITLVSFFFLTLTRKR
jgi:hypothetical protein